MVAHPITLIRIAYGLEGVRMPGRIARDSLLTLEAYARERHEFRAKVIAHKKNRTVRLGANITLIFEDELTIRYQIQEMLRIEKTFEERGIQEELDAYVPLIPDGTNLKATMMIEYEDPTIRKIELARLKGVESRVYVEVDGSAKGVCSRRRGLAARERRKDIVGPLSSLRVRARDDSRVSGRALLWRSVSIIRTTRCGSTRSRPKSRLRSRGISARINLKRGIAAGRGYCINIQYRGRVSGSMRCAKRFRRTHRGTRHMGSQGTRRGLEHCAPIRIGRARARRRSSRGRAAER